MDVDFDKACKTYVVTFHDREVRKFPFRSDLDVLFVYKPAIPIDFKLSVKAEDEATRQYNNLPIEDQPHPKLREKLTALSTRVEPAASDIVEPEKASTPQNKSGKIKRLLMILCRLTEDKAHFIRSERWDAKTVGELKRDFVEVRYC